MVGDEYQGQSPPMFTDCHRPLVEFGDARQNPSMFPPQGILLARAWKLDVEDSRRTCRKTKPWCACRGGPGSRAEKPPATYPGQQEAGSSRRPLNRLRKRFVARDPSPTPARVPIMADGRAFDLDRYHHLRTSAPPTPRPASELCRTAFWLPPRSSEVARIRPGIVGSATHRAPCPRTPS